MKPEGFWSRVDKSGPCWLWRGAKASTGYGNVLLNGVYMRAHRVAYALTNGPIPLGQHVCHHCDTAVSKICHRTAWSHVA